MTTTDLQAQDPKPKSKLVAVEKWLAIIAVAIATLLVVLPDYYPVMLARSYAYHFLVAGLFLVVWMIMRRQWWKGGLATVAVVLLYQMVGPVLDVPSESDMKAPGLRIAQFNVLAFTNEHDSTIQRALETDADIISFQEVSKSWAHDLENGLSEVYPYHFTYTDDHPYGLAVYSKLPLKDSLLFVEANNECIGATVEWEGQEFAFITSHLQSPVTLADFKARNRQLDALAEFVSQEDRPIIVTGDFNTVPWDKTMLSFKSTSHLRDSRKGLQATYPKKFSFLQIPIDYIFHSDEFSCAGFEVLDPTSSDHMGICGVYSFKKQ